MADTACPDVIGENNPQRFRLKYDLGYIALTLASDKARRLVDYEDPNFRHQIHAVGLATGPDSKGVWSFPRNSGKCDISVKRQSFKPIYLWNVFHCSKMLTCEIAYNL